MASVVYAFQPNKDEVVITIVNLTGALENYILVIAWIIGWKIEEKRQDE